MSLDTHDFEESSEQLYRGGLPIRAKERVWICKKCGFKRYSKPVKADPSPVTCEEYAKQALKDD